MSVTFDVSQPPMSWLNCLAPSNMALMDVTFWVFHLLMS